MECMTRVRSMLALHCTLRGFCCVLHAAFPHQSMVSCKAQVLDSALHWAPP